MNVVNKMKSGGHVSGFLHSRALFSLIKLQIAIVTGFGV